MAYRVTEKIQAQLDSRRAKIIKATIDVIKQHGMIGLTVAAVCKRGKFSMGLIYKEFPDVVEMLAATMEQLLAADLTEMRLASAQEKNQMAALAAALEILFTRWTNTRLVKACIDDLVYRAGIRAEIERLLKPAATDLSIKERTAAAAGALGALYGLHDVSDGSRARAREAVCVALRGIGFTHAQAVRVTA